MGAECSFLVKMSLNEIAILAISKFATTVDADAAGTGSRLAVNVFWASLKKKKNLKTLFFPNHSMLFSY